MYTLHTHHCAAAAFAYLYFFFFYWCSSFAFIDLDGEFSNRIVIAIFLFIDYYSQRFFTLADRLCSCCGLYVDELEYEL